MSWFRLLPRAVALFRARVSVCSSIDRVRFTNTLYVAPIPPDDKCNRCYGLARKYSGRQDSRISFSFSVGICLRAIVLDRSLQTTMSSVSGSSLESSSKLERARPVPIKRISFGRDCRWTAMYFRSASGSQITSESDCRTTNPSATFQVPLSRITTGSTSAHSS